MKTDARSGAFLDLLLLAGARLVASAALFRSGLHALSDDDYARVVIAERFAEVPRLDPSGTSWLPFPFWLNGAAMRVLGSSIESARIVAFGSAALATWLIYAGARIFGLARGAALAGALLALLAPPSLVLGVTTTPELFTGALAAFALLCVASERAEHAPAAGTAILFATLSRYEAWPVALVAGLALAIAAVRSGSSGPSRRRAAGAILCFAGPSWWVVHNRLAHGAWLHFLARVSAYTNALHASGSSPASDAFAYARGLVTGCLFIVLPLVATIVGVVRSRSGQETLRRWLLPTIAIVALLLFLGAGALLGGSPTHHPERALLLVWLLGAVAVADRLPGLSARRASGIAVWAALGLLWAADWSLLGAHRDGGIDRGAEEALGGMLRSRLGPDDRVLVATPDYGYFAIVAAFGRPSAAAIDHERDPRRREISSLSSPLLLDRRLDAEGAQWLVAPSLPLEGLHKEAEAGSLAIYERMKQAYSGMPTR